MRVINLLFLCLVINSYVSIEAQWLKVNSADVGATGKIESNGNSLFVYGDKVLRSSDDGNTFEDITSNFPDDAYAIHYHNNELLGIVGINNIMVSADDGNTWSSRGSITFPSGSGAVLMMVSDGSDLYAVSNRSYVFKSTDNGANWSSIFVDISSDLLGIDFAVAGQKMVFVSAGGVGAVVSLDGGVNWEVKNPPTILGNVVTFNNEIYGGGAGIYKLDDSGNWISKNNGIPELTAGTYANSKGLVSSGDNIFVFVSTLFEGFIYHSNDNGENWTEYDTELPKSITTGLHDFITPHKNSITAYLYGLAIFAPNYTGVYKSNLTSTSVNDNLEVPSDFNLSQNYPNPFNPSTIIEYSLVNSEFVTLKVYDVLGNEISTLVNEQKNAGKYKMNFDASSLTSGIYIYRLSAGNNILSRKMILIK